MWRTWIQNQVSLTKKSRFSRTSDEWKYLCGLFYKHTDVLLLKYSLKVLSFQQFYKLWQIGLNKKQFFSFPSIKDCAKGSIHRSRSCKESVKRISTKDTYDSWNECHSLNNNNWTIKHPWRPQWPSLWRETWLVQGTPTPNFNNRLHSKSYKTSGASFYLRIQWILHSSMWPLTR